MNRLIRNPVVVAVAFAAIWSPGCSEEEPPEYSFESAGYDHTADPFADLQVAIQGAKQSGRQILMEVGGDWCIWCHHWERFLATNDDIREVLDQNFVVLKVNHGPRNLNEDFLAQFPEVSGYPYFFVLDADGDVLVSQDTAILEQGADGYDRQKILEFLRRN